MIRLIFYAIIIYFGYRIYKAWVKSLSDEGDQELSGSEPMEAEMIQDPQCGTYFMRQRGVSARIEGRTVYFCSESCRDAYMKEH